MTKQNLKEITDLTINELLNNEVILPSIYFEEFSKNALKLNINIKDEIEDVNKDVENIIYKEYSKIEDYMNTICEKTEKLNDSIKESKKAIKEKNSQKLTQIYDDMQALQDEITELKSNIYKDEITNTYNRKWIFKSFLNEDLTFKDSGIAVLVNILDLDYIKEEYGVLISNNLEIFIINKIKKELKNYNLKFEVSKFSSNNLMFFVSSDDKEELNSIFISIKESLNTLTLRSNSGILINGNIQFYQKEYIEKQDSKDIFEEFYIQGKQS